MNILFQLVDWVVSIGFSSFASVSAAAVRNLVDTIDKGISAARGIVKKPRARAGTKASENPPATGSSGSLAGSYLSVVLSVMHELYDLYVLPFENDEFILNDGFRYSLFDDFIEAAEAGRKKGRAQEQTDDINEEAVFAYTDAALQFIYDYADDLIALKERADALPPPTASRVSPGERIALVAELLAFEVLADSSDLLTDNAPNFAKIAQKCGIDPTSIYKPQFKTLISDAASARKSKRARREAFAQELFEVARLKRVKVQPPPARARNAGLLVGLPFTGKISGTASPWPIETIGASRHNSRSIEAAITDLWTSIAIIIFAWEPDRTGEVLSLEADCLEEGVDGWYLKSKVFKGRNHVSGSETRHPCPAVVVRAIQVATRLGAQARLNSGSNELFLRDNRLRESVSDQSSLRNRMADFAKRYVREDVAKGIKFIPRHFRRFFPTLWVNYYSYGGRFRALQRLLGHDELTTTILYCRRASRLDAVRESQTRMTSRLIGESVFNGIPLFGGAIKKVQSIIARLDFRISSPADLPQKLEKELRTSGIRVYPLNFGYCLWHSKARRTANCATKIEPGSAEAWPSNGKTETMCGGCANFFTTPIFEAFWSMARERHKQMEEDGRAPWIIRRLGRKGRRIAEQFLRKIRG
ncbi:hypothetical protein LJR030_004088 [Rhizobium sp. LjRoot30]|uniref:hypothetical protein n=1 Tax=Rhizobium sp. LjRoot30 TaxID=3342320 RepID=UPI003ECDDE50